MREITVATITETIKKLVIETALYLRPDIEVFYYSAIEKERSESTKEILRKLLKNAQLARQNHVAYCQDTGMEIIFCEIGQDVHVVGGDLEQAIQDGVSQGSSEGFLRQSVVDDPILRKNTGTNTPAIVHYHIVSGDQLTFSCISKGFGSENKGRVVMLNPTASELDIEDAILSIIQEAGASACPPFYVGVGLGGTLDKAAVMAKEALLVPYGVRNSKPHLAQLEERLIQRANALQIGPLGFGGDLTVIDLKIKAYATHIAGLPVAVNLGCHAVRTKTVTVC